MNVHPLTDFHYCSKCGSSHFDVYDAKSKRCADCGFVYYYNSAASTAAIILNEHNELLACIRADEPAKGSLDLPGGFCDRFETAEEGVAREVHEETGLRVIRATYLFSLPNEYVYSDFLVHTTDLFFQCEVANNGHAAPHDDASELRWIPIDELKADRFGLKSIRKGIQKFIELKSSPYSSKGAK